MRCPFCGSSYIMHRMVCPNCNNAMDSTLIAKLQQYSAQYNNVKFINFDISMFLEDIVNWFNTYGGNIHLLEVWGDLVDISRFPHITKMNWGFNVNHLREIRSCFSYCDRTSYHEEQKVWEQICQV